MSAGDVFYVIEEGTFTIFDNSGRELARVSKGSCFGELALLHQVHTRTAPPTLGLPDRLLLCALFMTVRPLASKLNSAALSINELSFRMLGDSGFGSMQDVRAANVKALTDGALLALHRDDFNTLLGSLTHIRHMWRFEALRKVSILMRVCGSIMMSFMGHPFRQSLHMETKRI